MPQPITPPPVSVRVSATTANLGPGFDAVGMALTLFADIRLSLRRDGAQRRNTDPMRRMVKTAARVAFRHAGRPFPRGVDVQIASQIPLGRGLGASAAARAAGLLGANVWLEGALSSQDLLNLGTELEGHADNIAPALFGGLQVVVVDGTRIARVPVALAPGLRCAVFVPDFSMPTHETRELLPARLSRTHAVFNSSRAALLIAALGSGRWDALGAATEERLHQRPRAKLFPRMFDLFRAAMDAGAFGAYLSGGGSTVLALCDADHAETVRDALVDAAAGFGIPGQPLLLDPCADGARVVESRK